MASANERLLREKHARDLASLVGRLLEHAALQDDTLLPLIPAECRSLIAALDSSAVLEWLESVDPTDYVASSESSGTWPVGDIADDARRHLGIHRGTGQY